MGKVLRKGKILNRSAGRLTEIAWRNEYSSILDVIAIFRPAHRVMLSMSARVIHVMHNIHVRVEDIAVYYVTSQGKVVESRREQEHIPSVFIVEGDYCSQCFLLVVLVIADDVLHEEMVLERGHIQVHHFESPRNQVIGLNSIVEALRDYFSVSYPCKIKDAILIRALNSVVEVEIEVLVHGEGRDCGYSVDIFMGLVLSLREIDVNQLGKEFVCSDFSICELNGACPQRDDVIG